LIELVQAPADVIDAYRVEAQRAAS
jgi:hypothetical protein